MVWESNICQKLRDRSPNQQNPYRFVVKKLSSRSVYLATSRVLWDSRFWCCRFAWISFDNPCPWSSREPIASRRLHESFTNGCFPPTAPDGELSENGFLMNALISMDFLWISMDFLWISMDFLWFHWFCFGKRNDLELIANFVSVFAGIAHPATKIHRVFKQKWSPNEPARANLWYPSQCLICLTRPTRIKRALSYVGGAGIVRGRASLLCMCLCHFQ